MRAIRMRRRAGAELTLRALALPLKENHLTIQAQKSYTQLLTLHHQITDPIQNFATGKFFTMADYDPVDSGPIG